MFSNRNTMPWNVKTKVLMVKGTRVKFTLEQAMKAHRGKKRIALFFL
jgi:hypothetical protein